MKRASELASSSISALAHVPRWGELEGRAALGAWRASGGSLAAFAAAHGLCAQRIRWWRKQLGAAEGVAIRAPTLVPIDVIGTVTRPDEVVAEVRVGRHVVRVLRGADEGTLSAVLQALERMAC